MSRVSRPSSRARDPIKVLQTYLPAGVLVGLGVFLLYLGIAGYSFGSQQVISRWWDQRGRGDFLIYERDRVAALGIHPFAADELVWISIGFSLLLVGVWWWWIAISAQNTSAKAQPGLRRRTTMLEGVFLIGAFTVSAIGLALEVYWVATGVRYSNYLSSADATSYILPTSYLAVVTLWKGYLIRRRARAATELTQRRATQLGS